MATSRSTKPMCWVRVGLEDLLLPIEDGMRLMKVLQNAVGCTQHYMIDGHVYVIDTNPLQIELRNVQPKQIRAATFRLPGGDQ